MRFPSQRILDGKFFSPSDGGMIEVQAILEMWDEVVP